MTGKLILCGTPIGNLEDLSPRAERSLREADVVACEDTRRTRKLLSHFGIRAKDLVVYHEGNERRQASGLFERIVGGETVVLVSDAGMPGLSDPGYRLVKLCADSGVTVEVVPGPSAAIAALAISGLPPGRFTFEGFFPRKKGDRRRRIEDLATDARTMIIYDSPHRIEETLEDLVDLLGERPAALARELTKMHEEVRRGSLADLLAGVRKEPPRGEIVLLIGGAVHEHKPVPEAAELAQMVRAMMEDGTDRKEAMHTVAREAGVPKRVVFDALVEERS
ncbi:MAG: 16S rRNA (cytidine(1402)-2'-O)-methyltransferase [Actinobacteria bacterium]|nr:16S rRNA (cytidine(1402)-2'-O)-methyltransferase [Actinomycetota bacterium]